VPNGEDHLQEAAKHGFKRAIVLKESVHKAKIAGLDIFGVNHVSEAMSVVQESCERVISEWFF
jgi:DNA repair protein RadA/Sms